MSICARLSANMNGDVSVRHKCGAGGYMPMLSDTNKCKILRVLVTNGPTRNPISSWTRLVVAVYSLHQISKVVRQRSTCERRTGRNVLTDKHSGTNVNLDQNGLKLLKSSNPSKLHVMFSCL